MFDKDTNNVTFTLNDATSINLDLTELVKKFYDKDYIDDNFYYKETVDDKINKGNVIVWNDF